MNKVVYPLLLFVLLNFNRITSFNYVDFDISMQCHDYQSVINQGSFLVWYNFLKQSYNQIMQETCIPSNLRIPKIIHQIWIGSPLPERYKKFQQSWLLFHPDWIYKLWTDEDLDSFNLYNKDLFTKSTNYGEKSDIWRYEILERFGGVYVDIDFECIKPFDCLHYLFDFYIGIQPLDTNIVQLGIGIIGTIPHHPLLQIAVGLLKDQHYDQIILRTGPLYFTRVFIGCISNINLRNIALPASYFYPCGYTQKGTSKVLWLKEETFAVHHWAGSWLTKQ